MKSRWAGYFEWLYQADPPAVELVIRGVAIHIADPTINWDPHSFVETQAAVNRLKWGKAPGICGIHAELFKAGGNAVPKRSTIDRILALRILTEHRREFWQGLLAAYVDLC